jgi:hypothetical protein
VKEQKTIFGFKKQVPEKEWEAKYLIDKENAETRFSGTFYGYMLGLIALLLIFAGLVYSTAYAQCEVTISHFGASDNNVFNSLEEQSADGFAQVTGPCPFIKTLLEK